MLVYKVPLTIDEIIIIFEYSYSCMHIIFYSIIKSIILKSRGNVGNEFYELFINMSTFYKIQQISI